MIRDPGRVTDGFASLERGVDSGKNPSLIPRNQAAWGENVTFRGGYLEPRPGWNRIALVDSDAAIALATAKFQGADFFDDATGRKGLLMVIAGGSLYRLELTAAGAVVTNVDASDGANSDVLPQAWTVQAENYFITQDGQSLPVIYDGAITRRATGTEVPIGSGPMAYGMLRLWVALGVNYVAGDVAGGPTGVLSFTENDYIAEGGEFSLPMSAGGITAMRFTATPNTGLGQGELLIFTPRAVFSNTAPVDRDSWKNLTQPIQTITIINQGGQSQASTVLVNSDVFMRSTDGIRTVIQAVRNFMANQWGNTPISCEMNRVLNKDTQSLLQFASAVEFDNRVLMTCQPVPIPNGCYHTGLVALDFDLVTSMGDKLPPAYDGLWTGPQIYRIVKGRFEGLERCFALCRSETDGFVWKIILTAAGTGYTSVPEITLSGGAGGGAIASAAMKALSVTVSAAGAGYAVNDILVASGGTNTVPVRILVTAVNGGGGVTAASVLIAGNYSALTAFPTPVTVGAATFTIVWGVASVSVSYGGSGYDSNPTVAFSAAGGSGATAVAVIEKRMELWELTKTGKFDNGLIGSLDSVRITAAGTGYTSLPTLAFSGGDGTGAAGAARLKVVSGAVSAGGAAYTVGDRLTVSGGTSTTAAVLEVTTVAAGVVTAVSVATGGAYSVLPANPVAVTGGTGAGATFNLTWGVGSVVVSAFGSGYTGAPGVSFTGGAGSGAAGVAVMDWAPLETRIEWLVETPSYGFNTNRSNPATLKRLETGDLWMDRVTGTVNFTIHYRPDQYPCWNPWYAWSVCSTKCVTIDAVGCLITAPEEQYRPRMTLPQPPELAEPVVAKSMRTGYEFSVRLAGTGFARIKLLRMHAKELVETVANPVAAASETCATIACDCD